MLNNILKGAFTVIGIVTGITISTLIFPDFGIQQNVIITVTFSACFGMLLFFISSKSIKYFIHAIDKFETIIHSMTIYEITMSVLGLIAGLIIANLISIPVVRIDIIGVPISVVSNILFGSLGIYIASSKKNETVGVFYPQGREEMHKVVDKSMKLLDTSSVIDGRIIDVCTAGFLEGKIIIPSFVIEELRYIADSADSTKRVRGRRGLDVLDVLQKEMNIDVVVQVMDDIQGASVDDKLLRAAQSLGAKIITNDFNLNKVAKIHGVSVLNINDLSNAVKPIALPGEEMSIQVVKDGKENGQGIGYLNDGTMIVVEGGKKYLGQLIEIVVTSVLQTSAGRMIFARPK